MASGFLWGHLSDLFLQVAHQGSPPPPRALTSHLPRLPPVWCLTLGTPQCQAGVHPLSPQPLAHSGSLTQQTRVPGFVPALRPPPPLCFLLCHMGLPPGAGLGCWPTCGVLCRGREGPSGSKGWTQGHVASGLWAQPPGHRSRGVGPATWGPRRVSLSLVTQALPGVERWCPVCHAAASALVWEGEFHGAAGTTWGPLGVPEADQVPEGRAGVLGLFPGGLFWFFVASHAPRGWHFTVYVACIGSLSLTLACGAPQTWARWAPTAGWA